MRYCKRNTANVEMENTMALTRTHAEDLLRIHFRLNQFYDEQWETIESLLEGQRILLIYRTGFGKSLCYQFPAILFDGITIVFSPLIALMRDQIQQLKSLGISAECINSEPRKHPSGANQLLAMVKLWVVPIR